jgi:hypothetical protein
VGNIILLEVVGILLAWVVAGYTIWKWGPGFRRRSVGCPEKGRRATVLAEQREAEFGCLRVVDVHRCSLMASAPLACDKACLPRL